MMPMATNNHALLAESRREKGLTHFQEAGLGLRQDENLDEITNADGGDEDEDDRLDEPHPQPLQGQQQQHVEGGDEDGPEARGCEKGG